MKKVKIFAFCDGELSPATVWYHVPIGISERDRRADRNLTDIVKKHAPAMFYAVDSVQVSTFLHRVRISLFGKSYLSRPLRQVYITPQALLAKLRTLPLAFLNI